MVLTSASALKVDIKQSKLGSVGDDYCVVSRGERNNTTPQQKTIPFPLLHIERNSEASSPIFT